MKAYIQNQAVPKSRDSAKQSQKSFQVNDMTRGSELQIDPVTVRVTKTEAPPRGSWTESEWQKIQAANDVSQLVPQDSTA